MITIYHVVTDNKEFYTQHYDHAEEAYYLWKALYGKARLYKEVYASEQDYQDDKLLSEETLLSFGDEPDVRKQ